MTRRSIWRSGPSVYIPCLYISILQTDAANEEPPEEDIDEEKSILRLPGKEDFLPVIFRHLARQGQCVLDLRLVCQEFNRIILGMIPAISCKDNFLRNLDPGITAA